MASNHELSTHSRIPLSAERQAGFDYAEVLPNNDLSHAMLGMTDGHGKGNHVTVLQRVISHSDPVRLSSDVTAANQHEKRGHAHHKETTVSGNGSFSRLFKTFTSSWWLEIAALSTSMAFLAGIAILFVRWNGKESSSWSAKLSFTTIIAIVSKIIQASLAVPISSCLGQMGWLHYRKQHAILDMQRFGSSAWGPIGATRLLMAAPSILAILSFVATIGGLGYEAALQQSLKLVGPNVIPILTSFDVGGIQGPFDAMNLLNAAMQVYMGPTFADVEYAKNVTTLLDATMHEPPRFVNYGCTQGCRPPRYATMSMCLACDRIGSQVGPNNNVSVCVDGGGCSNPKGQDSSTVAQVVTHPAGYWQGNLLLANFTVTAAFKAAKSAPDISTYVVSHHCIIETCVKILELDVSKGGTGLTGAKEMTLVNITQGSGRIDVADADADDLYWKITIPKDVADTYLSNNPDGWDRGTRNYTINGNAYSFLSDFLYSFFDSQSRVTSDLKGSSPGVDPTNVAQGPAGKAFWDFFLDALDVPKGGTVDIHNMTDIQAVDDSIYQLLNKVITRMANEMRDYQGHLEVARDPDDVLSKDVNPVLPTIHTTIYQIDWIWVAIPAIVELAVVCLLVGTLSATRHAKLPIWKESVIAIMFRGVQPEVGEECSYTDNMNEMEALAGELCVGLEQTACGYRLVPSRDTP